MVAQLVCVGDGVPDALEGPDLVNDGQKTSTPGGTIVEVDDPAFVLELNPNSSLLTLPSGINLGDPIDIQIDLTSTGSSSGSLAQGSAPQTRQEVTVTLTLPEGFMATTYYHYGPEPSNPEPHWYEFLFDGRTGATIKGQRILLRLVDGLRQRLQTRVSIQGKPSRGRIEVEYFSQEDLRRIAGILLGDS